MLYNKFLSNLVIASEIGSHHLDQSGLELAEIPHLCSLGSVIKGVHCHARQFFFFFAILCLCDSVRALVSPWGLILFFHHVDPEDCTQVIRFGLIPNCYLEIAIYYLIWYLKVRNPEVAYLSSSCSGYNEAAGSDSPVSILLRLDELVASFHTLVAGPQPLGVAVHMSENG